MPAAAHVYDLNPTAAQLKKARMAARLRFKRARMATARYERQLVAVARQIGVIVKGFAPDGVVKDSSLLSSTLVQYARLLQPWATRVAARMIAEVSQRDENAWAIMGRELGRGIRQEIKSAPTGEIARKTMAEQVALITSLPIEAGKRVHELSLEALSNSERANELAQAILETGHVTASRARTIARTEVGRAQGAFTSARAQHVGSEGYIWRTAGDGDVRPYVGMPSKQRAKFVGSHRKLEGKFIRWDQPPVSGQRGEHAHAGMIYNCRCWMEPVLPDKIA